MFPPTTRGWRRTRPWRWLEPCDFNVVQTGAWILLDERPLPEELEAFLNACAAPLYVSFGSMPMHAVAGWADGGASRGLRRRL